MQKILRNIIWAQTLEIIMMKDLLDRLPNKISDNSKMNTKYVPSILDFYYPEKSSVKNVECDAHFFDSEKHMEHLKHLSKDKHSKLPLTTNRYYLEHMTGHHQVAVDMSKRLLNILRIILWSHFVMVLLEVNKGNITDENNVR